MRTDQPFNNIKTFLIAGPICTRPIDVCEGGYIGRRVLLIRLVEMMNSPNPVAPCLPAA